ncbi:hypothetical protein DPEC_G00267050 [Dallia pectoralis]|uniref:Uncharacterized protein n=1 Tax=Dallia pectoralis TaxID=75939 RepID=A0ACC2FNH5_DALPE|nr:hypothetical protein DPEC_G00267050 [Dallia pectoralis]
METKTYLSIFALVSISLLCLNVKGQTAFPSLPSTVSPKPISTDLSSSSSSINNSGTVVVMESTMGTNLLSHTETPHPSASSVGVSTQSVLEKNFTSGNVTEKTLVTSSANQTDPSNTPLGPDTPHTPRTPVSLTTLSIHVFNSSTHNPKINSSTTATTITTITSTAKSSPPRPETTTNTPSTTQPNSTHSFYPKPTTTTSTTPPAIPQSVPQPNTSSSTQSLAPTSSGPAEAKTQTDTPSELNVVNGQPISHNDPALDPLQAGLVSAFIVSAALITLLLFIRKWRQNQQPEFRRLQDLPMDDMMEDTPLSMYSY